MALFAVCAQGSAILPYSAWPYAAHHAPITQYSSYPAHVIAHASPISYAAHVAAPQVWAAPHVISAPHAYAVHSAHVIAAPHVVPVAKVSASYTAANRGSVHHAELPGHAISQTSLNLAPAPGTH